MMRRFFVSRTIWLSAHRCLAAAGWHERTQSANVILCAGPGGLTAAGCGGAGARSAAGATGVSDFDPGSGFFSACGSGLGGVAAGGLTAASPPDGLAGSAARAAVMGPRTAPTSVAPASNATMSNAPTRASAAALLRTTRPRLAPAGRARLHADVVRRGCVASVAGGIARTLSHPGHVIGPEVP